MLGSEGDLIYLDNNATTRVDPVVLEAMLPWLAGGFGNPSSSYGLGRHSAAALETAREQVATLLGCEADEIVFTSCGTESINTAFAAALAADRDRTHVVTSSVEHSATAKLCEHLARRGHEVTWLPVDSSGQIDLGRLEDSITDETMLVSLLWANNETGVLFPIDEIAEICRKKRVLFHCDAVQGVGKLPVRPSEIGVHFLSLSGHKFHCPKGVGALYVGKRTRYTPLLRGSQENARRGGTQNVASIVGLGRAAEIAAESGLSSAPCIAEMRDRFEEILLARVPGASVNGTREARLPNTTNLAFDGVDAEAALILLDERRVCCSAGSACTSGSVHASHVLRSMGCSNERARSSLRFSFGRFNTMNDAERGAAAVAETVEKLRELSPSTGPVTLAS